MKNIIAVSSGKEAASGKSSTAVNLALALAAEGGRKSAFWTPISTDPSIPTMLGAENQPSNFAGRYPYGTDYVSWRGKPIPIGYPGDAKRQCDGLAWTDGEQGVNADVAGNLVARISTIWCLICRQAPVTFN
ncbi:P-loop NTPase [Escherichia coli]|nr:P-loop NTPase [Escherichia coli]